jgi:hypothetical protein
MENITPRKKKSDSELFNLIAQSVIQLSDLQSEKFLKSSKGSNYLDIYNKMREGKSYEDCINQFGKGKTEIRESLNTLVDNLLPRLISERRINLFNSLQQAEVAFYIGLEEKGHMILEKLKSSLGKTDFWISWRIYELEFMFCDLGERQNLKAPESIYFFARNYFSFGNIIPIDLEELRDQSTFVNFLIKYKEEGQNFQTNAIKLFNEIDQIIEDFKDKKFTSHLDTDNFLINEQLILHCNFAFNKIVQVADLILSNKHLDFKSKLYTDLILRIETFKMIISNYLPFSHSYWQNYLGLFLGQVTTELSICSNLLHKKFEAPLNSIDTYWGYEGVQPISSRIEILTLCSKILMLEKSSVILIKQLKEISIDISNLTKPTSSIKLDENTSNSLMVIRVLLSEISGPVQRKVAGNINDLRRILLKKDYFKQFIGKNKIEIELPQKPTYLDYTMQFIYNLSWERKAAKRDFINDIE